MLSLTEAHALLQRKLTSEEYEEIAHFIMNDMSEAIAAGYRLGYSHAKRKYEESEDASS